MADLNIRAPLETPMHDDSGRMTHAWQQYFATLRQKLNDALETIEVSVGSTFDTIDVAESIKVAGTQVVGPQQSHIADAAEHTESDEADASAVSAISLASGSDQVDRATFNTDLSTLVSEINALKDKHNTTIAKLNALADDYTDLRSKFNTLLSQTESHGLNASS